MRVMIITGSPNIEGLTASCGKAAQNGAEALGAKALLVNLNKLKINHCKACGNGWGPCRNQHDCQVKDDFQELHATLAGVDAFVLVTPVYWGDLSESAKAFLDRVRRTEAFKEDKTYFEGKPVIAIAAAGGSGNGITSTLTNMEKYLLNLRAEKFDLIGVTQKNRGYKMDTIYNATQEMVKSISK